MSEKSKMTVDQTGVITYYAVTFAGIDYTVTDMYDCQYGLYRAHFSRARNPERTQYRNPRQNIAGYCRF